MSKRFAARACSLVKNRNLSARHRATSREADLLDWHATTILSVRKGGRWPSAATAR